MDEMHGRSVACAIDRERWPIPDACRTEYGQGNACMATCYPRGTGGSQGISPEERWQAIAVMAYHLARARGFVGEAVKYWLVAEKKVDAELTTR